MLVGVRVGLGLLGATAFSEVCWYGGEVYLMADNSCHALASRRWLGCVLAASHDIGTWELWRQIRRDAGWERRRRGLNWEDVGTRSWH